MEALKEALENKKALLIALAAAFGMIVVAVAVTLIIRGRSAERFSNDDVPYPYAWVEKRDGSITMTLESGKAKNSAWSVESTQGVSTEVTVGKTGGKKTSVTITPVEEGPERVTFVLTSGEEQLAELAVTASVENVDERFVTHIISSRERAMQGAVHGGEETGHAFTVRADDEGLTIFVEESEVSTEDGAAWASDSSDTMTAYVSTIGASDGGLTVHLQARSNGTAEVRVYSVRDNISFVFDVEVTDGQMLLTDSRVEPYETEESEPEAAEEAAEAAESESTAAAG